VAERKKTKYELCFILAHLPIVLSVLLWLMVSDYPFGIFKHVLSFCPFSFDHCVVYHSSIYGFCLPFGIFLIFRFMCILLWIIVRPFVFFLSATMFSVFLPFTASDYPFVIFKQFSSIDQTYINYAAGTSSFSKDSMYTIHFYRFI
jgi:hypothetical protein